MRQTKRPNIIFDLDNTLISARRVYQSLEGAFVKRGIKREEFQRIYRVSKKGGIFNLRRFISLIGKDSPLSQKKTKDILNNLFKEGKKFLYPDVFPFLKKWSKKGDLFLVSLGDRDFQLRKLKSTNLLEFFKRVFITKDERKIKEAGRILKKEKITFFVEDNPETLFQVKKNLGRIITVRIKRGEGKYKDLPDNKNIDFAVRNLQEFDKILEKSLKKPKALVLFSGGLDSILAAKILQEQGIEIKGITFRSYFFDERKAVEMAKKWKIPLKIMDISRSHLRSVKKPRYGYGKSMNPCLDCRILMLKKAKEIMKKEKFDFVATGEVLGERPMTQNRKAFALAEKESRLEGFLLRPLSAKLLPKTIPEKLLWVEREKLLDIRGRSRKKQMALAKKLGIKNYPTPAGGCLLTDPEFGRRLKELLKKYPKAKGKDVELLKVGRHFWKGKIKIVVGRNEKENKKIKSLAQKGDVLIEMQNYPGPLTILRNYGKGKIGKEIINKGKELTQYYSLKAREKKNIVFKILTKK